jgi:hypothetical protein
MPSLRATIRLYLKKARRKMAAIMKVKAAKELALKPGGWITPVTEEERQALTQAEALLKQHGLLPKSTKMSRGGPYDSWEMYDNAVLALQHHLERGSEKWEGLCETVPGPPSTPDN